MLLRKVDVDIEKEENIWRMTIFGPRRRKRTELAKGESFGEGKLMVTPTNQPGEYSAICLFEC